MPRTIVSRNYFNRAADKLWLVRKENETPTPEHAVSGVIAKDVVFCPSSNFESRFGCHTVAVAQSVNTFGATDKIPEQEPTPGFLRRPISYQFGGFVDDQGNDLEGCQELILMPGGKMFAVVPATETATVAAG